MRNLCTVILLFGLFCIATTDHSSSSSYSSSSEFEKILSLLDEAYLHAEDTLRRKKAGDKGFKDQKIKKKKHFRYHHKYFKLPKELLDTEDYRTITYFTTFYLHQLFQKHGIYLNEVSEKIVKKSKFYKNLPIEDPKCDETYRYRTYNGQCNNFKHPYWGSAGSPLIRLLPPHYGDGFEVSKVSANSGEMPSARYVSSHMVDTNPDLSDEITHMVMQWGQLLDHDITLSPFPTEDDEGEDIDCCDDDQFPENLPSKHDSCMPIPIATDDHFYKQYNKTCFSFTRSLPAAPLEYDGPLKLHRNQFNAITAFIDASNVYGSSEEEAEHLRSHVDGKLRIGQINPGVGDDLLPPNPEDCTDDGLHCFLAGDERSNEHPGLSTIHTIFLREHNRIAELLKHYNPGWCDEMVYQETRKIVGAIMQHITYKEFLPILFGKVPSLLPREYGFADVYNEHTNPGIANEVSAAAYRIGHSLARGRLDLYDNDAHSFDHFKLHEVFFQSDILYESKMASYIAAGLVNEPATAMGMSFPDSLHEHLFNDGNTFGGDLIAFNIHRGRDHGLQSYNAYREFCGLEKLNHFKKFKYSNPNGTKFENAYTHYDDIELFIGGVGEHSENDGILGPTLACILIDQFTRLKEGDRFWYENKKQFTIEQLNSIRKYSLSKVLCHNTIIEKIQRNAFLLPNDEKPRVHCDDIEDIDFSLWTFEDYYV